jgi:integrase
LAIAVRIGELINARHDDVDEFSCTLSVKLTKRGNAMLVPLPPMFMRAYQELKTLRRPGNPHLFPALRGTGPMSPPRRAFKKVLIAAGIKERRILHDARKTAATVAINCPGVTLLDVSRSLNHASIRITEQRYLVTDEDRIRSTLTQSSTRLEVMLNCPSPAPKVRHVFRPTVRSVVITNEICFITASRKGGVHSPVHLMKF